LASDQRRYLVPCPKCGHPQTLRWEQVEWGKNEAGEHLPETAAYRCESRGARWSDGERLAAVRLGHWQATRPFAGTAGFHLSALYSPWVELADLVSIFLEAKDHPEQLKAFVNLTLGETWERKNVGKVPLFLIGVDSAKELIYARLRIEKSGPAFLHFPDSYDECWFEQLTAEKIVTKYHRGFARRQWVKVRARNEALDVRVENVVALAGLLSMGLDLSREAANLEARVHAVAVGARSATEAYAPQRRVRSTGIQLNL